MANKKKQANPDTVQFNKLISELPEKREKIKSQIGFRHELLESQKRVNNKSEFDRLQGAKKKTARIECQCKIKNERATEESKAIIKWWAISSYLFNEILI